MAPRTAHVSAPVLMAGQCWPMTLQETLRHAQAGLLQSPVDHCSFPLGPVHTRLYLCPPSVPVSPQPCGSSVIKSHCPSKSGFLGIRDIKFFVYFSLIKLSYVKLILRPTRRNQIEENSFLPDRIFHKFKYNQ